MRSSVFLSGNCVNQHAFFSSSEKMTFNVFRVSKIGTDLFDEKKIQMFILDILH